jgi:hypothetical protein
VRAAVMGDAGKAEAKARSMQRGAAAAPQLWRSTGNTLSRDDVKRTT